MRRIVIIGGGQAASALIAKLVAEKSDDRITLVCAEPRLPYQRPPLSKAYLLGEMAEDRLYFRPAAWYDEHGVDVRLNSRADSIDKAAKTVTLDGGEVLAYDELVLTTGAHPRTLPASIGGTLGNVFAVRDLDDADAMEPAFVAGARALIVGGGYIGLEAAAVAAKRGVSVTLVEAADRILQRVAAPETSDFFRDLHRRHGVDIREGVGLTALTGDDVVTGATLSDGTTLDIDFAIVGVGIAPATALAEGAGLVIDNGISTDAHGRTSDPHIWAAGDCASAPCGDGRVRIESVGNAIDQAEIVAHNLLGRPVTYTPKPWFWSDQYDVKLQIAGLNTGYTDLHVRDVDGARSHWYYRGETLLAIDSLSDTRAYMVGKRLIEAGKSPAPSVVTDADTDLKALLRA
ncbi:3-phenylpropionate/trans-cinnamate dioxygenase ferredoxin reductase subunit [Loktanella sp. DSM 29012]|uniref:NAD(P)/FAD-dependent oxidoreductase n=1 Tax=Loktanella sp. DSM 29012 TaxID=1881056 RepID=UPI0008BEDC20|nr:FAD-dependent oxidoreductase [Loktanella sp. DSM 29012]SEQ74177.1 3-phenylpropionate/trans-cinnamate dioxygenase ferredoxin reductase subunit [Loktanella sp. DSM 29012]